MTVINSDGCELTFECTRKLSDLTSTNDESIRHCSSCDENVHWCDTQKDIDRAKKKGWCVAYRVGYKTNENDYAESIVGTLSKALY